MDLSLWKPTKDAIEASQLTQFIALVNQRYQCDITQYSELHQWSVKELDTFWRAVWDFCEIKASKPAILAFEPGKSMRDAHWFPDSQFNFAENLLWRRDNGVALIYQDETGQRFELTFNQLAQRVASVAHHLKSLGISAGDRVVGCLTNRPETIIAMLASASLGAIWSSCSPDFGENAIIDRFSQIEPKVLFAIDCHYYNGKQFNHLEKIQRLQNALPSLKQTILMTYKNHEAADTTRLNQTVLYSEIADTQNDPLSFEQLPFNHPLYILYSSGTTGKPKCIVHGAGGTLLQHKKELRLHCNIKPEERFFYFTTCGWMMWNWLVSGLSVGATLVLYEGSPFYPGPQALFDLIDNEKINVFGISAKFIEAVDKSNYIPMNSNNLSSMRLLLSTGSPLLPQSYDFIYANIKKDLCVSSITGGTDIISLFGAPNITLPVYRGEIQCIGLGMDVKIIEGELCCESPFPCMPVYFWDDPDGKKYHDAYFNRFENIWAHGDYAEITTHGGLILYGRSDATLNPGGVRIGTAEIYNQMEKIPEVLESLAIGKKIQGDERIILFVVMKNNLSLTGDLIDKIKKTIRSGTSPHHVPDTIIQAPNLPRTLNGKLSEIAVKKIIHGEAIKNTDALANPESLEFFKQFS